MSNNTKTRTTFTITAMAILGMVILSQPVVAEPSVSAEQDENLALYIFCIAAASYIPDEDGRQKAYEKCDEIFGQFDCGDGIRGKICRLLE